MTRNDWIEVELGDACFTTSGGTPSRKVPEYFIGDIPWVKSGELNYNVIKDTEEHISEEAIADSSAKIFPEGTLLVALYGATIGKLAILGIPAATNQAVCGIYQNKCIETRFLFYYLVHNRQKLIKQGAGGAQPNISQTILKKLRIRIAPLPEQRAIVAKIEQLFSELDNGIANLKAAKEKLETYRQTVLKQAFEGELTSVVDRLRLVPLGDEVNIVSGSTPKGLKNVSNSGEIPFYKVSDMNSPGNEVEMRGANIVLTREEVEELRVRIFPKGTVIFPKRGGAILTNKKRMLSTDASFDLNIMGVVPNDNYSSKYLYYFFLGYHLGQLCDGSTVPQINNKHIAPLLLPKCALSEQARIVEAVESRLSVCDNVMANIEQGLAKSETLRQSILKKAFEGKLLSEEELEACRKEPDWEPADKLLERIKKQRNEQA